MHEACLNVWRGALSMAVARFRWSSTTGSSAQSGEGSWSPSPPRGPGEDSQACGQETPIEGTVFIKEQNLKIVWLVGEIISNSS